MGTRKHRKSKKSNKRFRKTRSKKQKGSGANCSRPGQCTTDQNMEEEDPNTKDDYLRQMILDEDAVYVEMYLEEGANPNIMITDEHEYLQQPEQVPAIIYAARHIQPATILKHLVNHGASIEQNDNTGTTPLIEAAEWGNLPAVKYLLKKGANINATTHTGVTAIGYAILNEDIPMINLMLKKRKGIIDFNYTIFDTNNENVIDDAQENAQNTEVAKILKKYAIEQKLPIHSERQNNRLEVGRVMDKKRMPGDLTHKIITEHFGGKRKTRKAKKSNKRFRKTRSKRQKGGMRNLNEDLIDASSYGHPKIVKTLLDNGADVNAMDGFGNSALYWASFNGHKKVVKLLNRHIVAQTIPRHLERQEKRLQVGRVMDKKGMPGDLTHKIITEHFGGKRKRKSNKSKKRIRRTRSKRQMGGGKEEDDKLIKAIWNGRTEIVAMLLEKGADANAKSTYGRTALCIASMEGHTKIVAMLLEKGADVNAKSSGGWTALHLADEYGHGGVVNILIRAGATIPDNRQDLKDIREEIIQQKLMAPLVTYKGRTEENGSRLLRYGQGSRDIGRHMSKFLGGKRKSKKSKRKNRITRSKRQRGGGEEEDEELIKASLYGHKEIVTMLLEKGV